MNPWKLWPWSQPPTTQISPPKAASILADAGCSCWVCGCGTWSWKVRAEGFCVRLKQRGYIVGALWAGLETLLKVKYSIFFGFWRTCSICFVLVCLVFFHVPGMIGCWSPLNLGSDGLTKHQQTGWSLFRTNGEHCLACYYLWCDYLLSSLVFEGSWVYWGCLALRWARLLLTNMRVLMLENVRVPNAAMLARRLGLCSLVCQVMHEKRVIEEAERRAKEAERSGREWGISWTWRTCSARAF